MHGNVQIADAIGLGRWKLSYVDLHGWQYKNQHRERCVTRADEGSSIMPSCTWMSWSRWRDHRGLRFGLLSACIKKRWRVPKTHLSGRRTTTRSRWARCLSYCGACFARHAAFRPGSPLAGMKIDVAECDSSHTVEAESPSVDNRRRRSTAILQYCVDLCQGWWSMMSRKNGNA